MASLARFSVITTGCVRRMELAPTIEYVDTRATRRTNDVQQCLLMMNGACIVEVQPIESKHRNARSVRVAVLVLLHSFIRLLFLPLQDLYLSI